MVSPGSSLLNDAPFSAYTLRARFDRFLAESMFVQSATRPLLHLGKMASGSRFLTLPLGAKKHTRVLLQVAAACVCA
ncbi:hypothetical protein JHY03_68480 (plasmid) [Streptomyces sp. CA-256286]|nr:hypothetical protein JHY03_68480 [Streptomyces sp. CA-256286]